ncbi:protein phosphatase 2C domain-containing protein [Streptomyces sp. NPDC059578]|uniref:protein phosphatase 2C domain-containing protein n=1 Tax=Streptomyces sp. NPDC059578 TaxID=3346874 RepID=UPI00369867A3
MHQPDIHQPDMHQPGAPQPGAPQEWPPPASGPEEPPEAGQARADALDEAWNSLPSGVGAVAYRPVPPPPPAPEPFALPEPVPETAPVPHAPVPESAPVLAPAPVPAAEGAPAGEPTPPGVAAEAVRAPVAVPLLGPPRHSGPKPPLYAPHPGTLPSVRDDLDGAVVADIVVDGATHGALTVRAASIRGDSHRYEGGPRQDALCVTRLGGPDPTNGLLLLTVADGVGSAARSHIGSHEVSRSVALFLDRYAEQLAESLRAREEPTFSALVNSAVGSAAEGLARSVAERGGHPADHATTLRGLLVPLDPQVRHRGFFAVGDGGGALLREGVWTVDVFGEGQGGSGVIDTGTEALPGSRFARSLIYGPALPGDLLVLCTDGLSTPLAGDPGMRDFLAGAWGSAEVPGPVDFLWQLQYRVKSYDDDRTAVCLWEGPEE